MKEEEVEDEPIRPVQKREIVSQTAVEGTDEGFSSVGKGGKTVIAVTSENLLTRLREVLESRGKKVNQHSYHLIQSLIMTIEH
jgi:translation initiation factor 3 subunit C